MMETDFLLFFLFSILLCEPARDARSERVWVRVEPYEVNVMLGETETPPFLESPLDLAGCGV